MEEKKERIRKERQRGTVTQKMMSFRVDIENAEYLEQFQNKGRYINDLLTRERTKNKK